MEQWTVHIKNFGKMEEASVQVAPLTLLIGDNNSGKSYIMTLIYGLCNMDFLADSYRFQDDSQVYQDCCGTINQIVAGCWENRRMVYTLQGAELRLFQELLNEFLALNKQVFLERLFNKQMDIEAFNIEFPMDTQIKIVFSAANSGNHTVLRMKGEGQTGPFSTMILAGHLILDDERYSYFLFCILRYMLRQDHGLDRQVYLPVARTGFLLTYKQLMERAVQDRFSIRETEKNLLTKPNTDFLMALSKITVWKDNPRFEKMVSFMEQHILKGNIQVPELPVNDIRYQPYHSDEPLPMYVSSGVVTEVTPLLLFLKYNEIEKLFMEEPEISLHPQLQWEMARVLIRIMNMGVPVFVTTHSDIILQHVNNMIKASELQMPEKTRFMEESGYEEDDLLSRKHVAVYQFDEQENGKTRLTKLLCGDYGFEAMTFYHTLKKMNEQIDWIEGEER